MNFAKTLRTALCLFLCLILCTGALAGCESAEESSSTESSSTSEETTTSASGSAEKVEPFDFSNANIEDYITLDASKYQSFSISIDNQYEITDENVTNYINKILENNKQTVKITDRAVKNGDAVMIYYEGLLDGVAFSGGTYAETETSEPYKLVIGSHSFIDGFEEGLIGYVPSETSKESPAVLNLKFPDDYHSADLAGKEVVFNVYIKYIDEGVTPEYNEKTVTEILGFKAEGDDVLAEFEASVKEHMAQERDSQALAAAYEYLMQSCEVTSYPEQAVEYWCQYYIEQFEEYVAYYQMYGYPVTVDEIAIMRLGLSEGADWEAELTKIAQTIVKNTLVYYAIAQNQSISVSDQEYNEQVQYYIDYYESNGQTYSAEEIIDGIGEDIIRENALFSKIDDYVISNCTVNYVEIEEE